MNDCLTLTSGGVPKNSIGTFTGPNNIDNQIESKQAYSDFGLIADFGLNTLTTSSFVSIYGPPIKSMQ